MLEFGIRWLYPAYDPSGRVEYQCTEGAFTGPKNAVLRQFTNTGEFDHPTHFNAYGFRDQRDLGQSTARDIFVVGDSFSYGQGVEQGQRYSDLLDGLRPEQVFNISIPNNIDGYYRLLEYAQSLGANIQRIVIGVCMENDLKIYPEKIEACTQAPNQSNAILGVIPTSLQQLKIVLLKRSAVYALITSIVHQNPKLKQLAVNFGLINPNEVFQSFMNQFDEKAIQSSVDRVAALAANYQAVILIIPSRGLWQGEAKELQMRIHQSFVQGLQDKGLEVVDMKAVFEKEGEPLSHHYRNEGHWNAKGHRVAAQTLQRFIEAAD